MAAVDVTTVTAVDRVKFDVDTDYTETTVNDDYDDVDDTAAAAAGGASAAVDATAATWRVEWATAMSTVQRRERQHRHLLM